MQEKCSKGVVVLLHYNGISEKAEFDKFVTKHNVRTNKNFSTSQYSLAPYLKQ